MAEETKTNPDQEPTPLEEAVAASALEAAPEDQKGPTGGSFYNPAHVGSGTILRDGTYGAPLPDPNVAKLADQTTESDPAPARAKRTRRS